jgi:hypothetical protein
VLLLALLRLPLLLPWCAPPLLLARASAPRRSARLSRLITSSVCAQEGPAGKHDKLRHKQHVFLLRNISKQCQ